MRLLLAILLSLPLLSQQPVHIITDASPAPIQITAAADQGTDYIRITVSSTTGILAGDWLSIHGVRGCWRVNGTRYVASVVSGTQLDLLARDGSTILRCGGTFTAASSTGSKEYWARKTTSATLAAPPNIMGMDGLAGSYMTNLQSRDTVDNPAWLAIKAVADTTAPTSWNTTQWPGHMLASALVWHATGRPSSSTYKTNAITALEKFHQIYISPGCDETVDKCGRPIGAIEQDEQSMDNAALTKAIMHSELSAGQKTQFANSVLNNLGMNNDSETSCTNPFTIGGGTLTYVSGNTVTISPASESLALAVGDYINWKLTASGSMIDSSSSPIITAIDTGTGVVTINSTPGAAWDGTAHTWWYATAPTVYNSANCGRIWFQQHYSPNTSLATSGVSGGDPYPTQGGDNTSDQSNLMWWRLKTYILLGAVTCEDDVRGCEVFEHSQAYFMTRAGFYARNFYAGISSSGSAGYRGRVEFPFAAIVATLKSALTPSVDLTAAPAMEQMLYYPIFALLPTPGRAIVHQWGETSQSPLAAGARYDQWGAMAALSNSSSSWNYFRDWLENGYGNYTQAGLATNNAIAGGYAFLGVDWADAGTDYTTLPTQRAFGHPTEFDEDILGNPMVETGIFGAISKSNWTDNATSIGFWPLGPYLDHAYYRHVGNYQIYRGTGAGTGGWLYMDARSTFSVPTCVAGGSSCGGTNVPNTSSVEIGTPTSTAVEYLFISDVTPTFWNWTATANGTTLRNIKWAGSDYSGRSASEYAYLSYDAQPMMLGTAASTGVVNYSIYNYVHSKKSGRDYLLEYVDTSTVSSKRMRRYLHFSHNGQTGEGNTTSDARVIHTVTDATSNASMHTQVLLPSAPDMTDFHIVRTSSSVITLNPQVSASYPAKVYTGGTTCTFTASSTITVTVATTTGNILVWVQPSDCSLQIGHNSSGVTASTGTVTGGITAFPGSDAFPIAIWNVISSGFSTGGSYYTPLLHSASTSHAARRFLVELGTGTSSEVLIFHEPHGNQTDSATTTTNTQTADWNTVQIDHATLPAVVAFARGGETKETWSFTSTHAGTGQYVIAGLSPGNYEAQRGADTPIEFTVLAGDESATFDGAAGVWAVARTGIGPTIATTSLPDGDEDVAYSQTLAGVCGASPCSWSVASGALPTSLSLNSSTGEISGTPTVAGVFNFTIRYTDNSALYNDQPLSITIAAAAGEPLAFVFSGSTCTVGANCTPTPAASGGTAPYTYSATGLPAGVTLSSAGVWTNAATVIGDYEVTITATDDVAASLQSTGTVSVVVPPSAADFTLKRSVASASSVLIEISQSGFDANATIYGVLRGPLGTEAARIEFPPGPASRTGVVEGLLGGTTYQLHILGASSALYSSITTAANSTTNNSVRYQVSCDSVAGTTHLRLHYGGTSALGSTSSIVACSNGVASVTLTRDSGPLWIADDRCSSSDCTPEPLASHPARPYMIQ